MLERYLQQRGLTRQSLTVQIATVAGLLPEDMLFACGSVVEGLGNEHSDLDLFLITACQDVPCTSPGAVTLRVGKSLIDIRVVVPDECEALLRRFEKWAREAHHPRSALQFDEDERKFLHRLKTGVALWGAGPLQTLQDRIGPRDLARHKLERARYLTNTIQIDLAGLRDARDWVSMPFAAQTLLDHAADALLAAHGRASPNAKWRVRMLGQLPLDWEMVWPAPRTGMSAADLYCLLHRAPPGAEPQDILDHTQRTLAFARRVLPWSEWRLSGHEPEVPGPLPMQGSVRTPQQPLPPLDLDVCLQFRDGCFQLNRLQPGSPVLRLTPAFHMRLAQQAGVTLNGGATEGPNMDEDVEELRSFIRAHALELPALIDEHLLRQLIGSEEDHHGRTDRDPGIPGRRPENPGLRRTGVDAD
ncbi:MAG: hypothetical protein WDO56_11825 [Gammaproteobacteria bacterium]